MKLVKEYINEKFTSESDPIRDMHIGMRTLISKFMKELDEEDTDDNAFIVCAGYGKLDFVRYLLDAGANVHADNDAALRWASDNGHEQVVKLLLDTGADVHADNDYALRWASANGHEKVVKLLLDTGADVHAYDDAALRWASANGHEKVVKLLLDAGADVHADNDYALRLASANGHEQVVKLLKNHIAKEKKRVKESLNEKFHQDSDPIEDMGIGVEASLKLWCKKMM